MNTFRKICLSAVFLLMAAVCHADTGQVGYVKVGDFYYAFNETNKTASIVSNPKKYSGNLVIPESILYKETTYSVASIKGKAFNDCKKLRSITIPQSVTVVESEAFNGCSGLEELIIADGNQMLTLGVNVGYSNAEGKGIFYDCPIKILYLGRNLSYTAKQGQGYSPFYGNKSLTSVTIGNNVTKISDYLFSGCTNLNSSITLHDGITSIGKYAFNKVPGKIYANKGTYTLLALWNAEIEPYQIGTEKKLSKPYIDVLSTTQTTAKLKLQNSEEYTDFVFYKGNYSNLHHELLESNEWTETGRYPEQTYTSTNITILKSADDNTVTTPISSKEYTTKSIGPYLECTSTASSISAIMTYDKGDLEVVRQKFYFDTYSNGNTLEVCGLKPNTSYGVEAIIEFNIGDHHHTKSKTFTVKTKELTLETEQPKVINTGNVIVKAKSNLNDAETNVGFEWRRTDWTDDFASNTGGAYLYDGEMEGYIRNLATTYLWKYRPYYVSDSGSRYYGEWVGIDPTNTSYFEPTVHTYDNVSVDGNTAKVRGYAQRGTDNITEQGFVYWKNNAAAAKGNGAKSASSVPGGAQTVTVKVSSSNPVIETTIAGLDYNTDYSYMAFVTTNEGTFYGEEQTFKTDSDPTGILDVTADTPQRSYPAGIYDLNGRKLEKMQRGINIVRFEDGTVKKIMVK